VNQLKKELIMDEMSNPIIGCILGQQGKHIAKMEFIKGCG